jgi:hypothetical protein
MPRKPEPKPSLVLLPGHDITLEDIIDFYRHLTGREPTPKEVEQGRREWEADGPSPPPTEDLEVQAEASPAATRGAKPKPPRARRPKGN